MNVRTEDGMTNGASNVVKKVQLHQKDKPSGIIWVQFDHADVGEKTRRDNRHYRVYNLHGHLSNQLLHNLLEKKIEQLKF